MNLRDFSYPKGNPSLLSADKNQLEEEAYKAAKAGSYFIHIDVMDGKFVPNTSFGIDVARNIVDPHVGHPFLKDTHLMVVNPLAVVSDYSLVSNIVTFHIEAINQKEEVLRGASIIKRNHAFAGLAINPETPLETIYPYLSSFDLILLMTVHPGKGGQPFDPNGLERISKLRKELDHLSNPPILEIDGGVNEKTAKEAIAKGAELLVAGSYLYGHDDFAKRFALLEGKE
mgnify:CR=1 FL=1